jgi:hypothetical protein
MNALCTLSHNFTLSSCLHIWKEGLEDYEGGGGMMLVPYSAKFDSTH